MRHIGKFILISPYIQSINKSNANPMSVFISYSREDREWLGRVREYLDILDRRYQLHIWDDSKIAPGSLWLHDIQEALQNAQVAVLLVSPPFLNSDFIQREELPKLLRSARQGGTLILPIILRPCLYDHLPELSKFQAFNSPETPLNAMLPEEQDAELNRLALKVHQHITANRKSTPMSHLPLLSRDKMRQSLATIAILRTLNQLQQGNSPTDVKTIQLASGIRSRKMVIQTLYQLLASGVTEQYVNNKKVNWKLSSKGLEWSYEVIHLLDQDRSEEGF
jgi:hypothetical protein